MSEKEDQKPPEATPTIPREIALKQVEESIQKRDDGGGAAPGLSWAGEDEAQDAGTDSDD